MNNKETGFVNKLSDQVNIKRWRANGIVVARTFSPLSYDIQCGRKLHQKVFAKWVTLVASEASKIIPLVA